MRIEDSTTLIVQSRKGMERDFAKARYFIQIDLAIPPNLLLTWLLLNNYD